MPPPCAAQEVKSGATKVGYVWQSLGCDSFYWQRAGRRQQKGGAGSNISYKYTPGHGPAVPETCPETGGRGRGVPCARQGGCLPPRSCCRMEWVNNGLRARQAPSSAAGQGAMRLGAEAGWRLLACCRRRGLRDGRPILDGAHPRPGVGGWHPEAHPQPEEQARRATSGAARSAGCAAWGCVPGLPRLDPALLPTRQQARCMITHPPTHPPACHRFPAFDRIHSILTTVSEELPDVPLYFDLHSVCKLLHCTAPKADAIRSGKPSHLGCRSVHGLCPPATACLQSPAELAASRGWTHLLF